MIYHSNLLAPDLTPYFQHLHCREMPQSMGHDVLSDFADRAVDDPVFGLYKNCGFWTHDEAAILFAVARQRPGQWLDIGAHTGWTMAHLASAGCDVIGVEPMLAVPEFAARLADNGLIEHRGHIRAFDGTANDFFATLSVLTAPQTFSGVVIDGDHDRPCPLRDAQNAAAHLEDTGVILFHDFIGAPVQEAVAWLLDQGFKCRPYWTPHMVAVCWRTRTDFKPPSHIPDPRISWLDVEQQMAPFDFARCV